MSFDPFGDLAERGYLRNVAKTADKEVVKRLEHNAFAGNVGKALKALQSKKSLSYQDVLETHATLFGDVYPWAGEDRTKTAPSLAISKAGMSDLFAHPGEIVMAGNYAVSTGSDVKKMRAKPGEVMGMLAYAHPFLDGNGRTIMTIHAELCRRADIHVDWSKTSKDDYLKALTLELQKPEKGHLDAYLKPYVRQGAMSLNATENSLTTIPGLNALHQEAIALHRKAKSEPAKTPSPKRQKAAAHKGRGIAE